MTEDTAELLAEADAATARGELPRARVLLEQLVSSGADEPEVLLKLAGVQRAGRQPEAALATVHRVLGLEPRHFMALLMRASLLENLGKAEAGQAWAHAVAQKPPGELLPHLAKIVERAERQAEAWVEARDRRIAGSLQHVQSAPDPDEAARIGRFRSNVLRRTRHYHSEPTHYHFPGLTEREFWPRRVFRWLEQLEAETADIAAELDAVLRAERAELVPYVSYDEHVAMDQWRPLNNSLDWTAIHLLESGRPVAANAQHCPRTLTVLDKIGQPRIPGTSPNAMFSLLKPHTRIPPHVGVSNARLVCHLPLIVPEGCWFRVGGETRFWRAGEALVFDDTIEHEAMNPTDQLRVVLIFDVWHPDLSPAERDAVAAIVGAERGQASSAL